MMSRKRNKTEKKNKEKIVNNGNFITTERKGTEKEEGQNETRIILATELYNTQNITDYNTEESNAGGNRT